MTVTLPWGSLLDGVLGRSPDVTVGLAGLLGPAGTIEALLSASERDGRGLPRLDEATAAAIDEGWRSVGLVVAHLGHATSAELGAMPSTWARRLRLGEGRDDHDRRTAWRLTLGRPPR